VLIVASHVLGLCESHAVGTFLLGGAFAPLPQARRPGMVPRTGIDEKVQPRQEGVWYRVSGMPTRKKGERRHAHKEETVGRENRWSYSTLIPRPCSSCPQWRSLLQSTAATEPVIQGDHRGCSLCAGRRIFLVGDLRRPCNSSCVQDPLPVVILAPCAQVTSRAARISRINEPQLERAAVA
jgi:hypothetical protein